MIHLSHHAEQRAAQRAGLKSGSARRAAQRAWRDGFKAEGFSGTLRRYLDDLASQHRGTTPVIYGEHIFIFGYGRVVVTILNLPHEFRRAVAKARLRRS